MSLSLQTRRPLAPLQGLVTTVTRLLVPRLDGFLDRIIADEAVGWAFDRRRPTRRVLIVARLNGVVVAEALADLPRRDLEAAGKGDGRCGFRLKLPSDLSPEDREALRIEGVVGLRRSQLKRAGRFRVEAGAAEKVEEPIRGPSAGFVERYSGRTLKGWAVDPNNPESPTRVDIFEGEVFLGSAPADIDRPKLRASGAPQGARGFEFKIPGDRTIDAEQLRVRIAGTRIDLRRSRSYPAEGPPVADAPVQQGASTRGATQGAETAPLSGPLIAPRRSSKVVALVICGPCSEVELKATLDSWSAQAWTDTTVAIVSQARPVADVRWFGPADEKAFRAFLDQVNTVIFLAPAQLAVPAAASQVFHSDPLRDVVWWPSEGEDPDRLDPDVVIRLGGRSSGLAVRAAALAGGRLPLIPSMAQRGLRAVEDWVIGEALSWGRVRDVLASPPPHQAEPASGSYRLKANAPYQRVSLAIWSEWGEEQPPVLDHLLGALTGRDVELLLPEPATSQLAARLSASANPALRSLQLRRVGYPSIRGHAALWRAMTEAATGQVVILCAGCVIPGRDVVRDCLGWAMQPGVGSVTAPIVSSSGTEIRGLPALQDGSHGGVGPVHAASALFLAMSRGALAAVGGIDPTSDAADLDLGLRLRRSGRSSVVLDAAAIDAPAEALNPWLGGTADLGVIGPLSEGAASKPVGQDRRTTSA